VLDGLAEQAWRHAGSDRPAVAALVGQPAAIRRRAIRLWLLAGGAVDLTDTHIRAVDALVIKWRGQGGVAVPSQLRDQRLFARRRDGHLVLSCEPVRPSG
jgi:tRNA(Ile)-lysidine synthase